MRGPPRRMAVHDAVTPTSASGRVYEILLDLIVSFRLKPFALISEKAVAEVLHISRSPVREALARLGAVRLVDIYAQRGTIVAPLRIEDLRRSQFLRECVEVGLLRRACGLSERGDLVKRLGGEIALQETLASIDDHRRFARSDELFHLSIAEAVGFEGVWSEISTAKLHMNRFRTLTFPGLDSLALIIAQHRRIAEAIGRGHEGEAVDAMQQHLRKIFPLVPALAEAYPAYFEGEGQDAQSRIHRPELAELLGVV